MKSAGQLMEAIAKSIEGQRKCDAAVGRVVSHAAEQGPAPVQAPVSSISELPVPGRAGSDRPREAYEGIY